MVLYVNGFKIEMTEQTVIKDVAIIGAGPAGLFAIFQCGMLNMSCVVIDTLSSVGGQCTALYPEKPIYDIPAYPKIDAGALIDQLEQQAAPFKPNYLLGQQVIKIEKQEDLWYLTTSKGTQVQAKAIIIAGGAGSFGPNRPPLAGIEAFEETSVFYMVRRRDDFKGKRVVIAGGGDSAVDWALSLAEVAESVAVVHRRDKFRAAPESVNQLRALAEMGKVELIVPYQLASLEGENGQLSKVHVKTLEGEERVLDVDVLLPFFGLAMNLGPIAEWGLDLHKSQIAINPATCETSVPGVFAIGDISHYPGKLKLILQGFSEGAMAAHAIFPIVHPGEALNFEHSTDKGVPQG